MDQELHWYALKVFWNRVQYLRELLGPKGIELYTQKIVPTLVFVHCTGSFILELRQQQYQNLFVYSDPKSRVPYIIPDKEMAVFRLVTSLDDSGLEFLGDDLPKYHEGDRVRVKEGPLKGAEGHIRRIRKDRRLVVTVSGVAAVATSFIHPSLLEKVD